MRCFTVVAWLSLSLNVFANETHEPVGAREPITDAAVYGEGVRSTPWRSPQEEREGFHLPPGFEIYLYAAEPQIAKPMNMAFDHRGRMWVTHSVEYPYPARDGQAGRDAVSILEDSDQDGSAERTSVFADGLNIPIGVLPYGDGCLCFSIPNIWYLRDTDGDGKCDQREVLLGPFDTTRDTHGMINALRDFGDGWIYACHGFNNQSQVAGTDGHVVKLHSGNTFRFRPDGSRVELVTHGQVNPFGMTCDEWGYTYTADCHSKPITQLVRGACYPSFGRPHDGLGFLPPMVEHLHGSTAISGIQFIRPDSKMVPLRSQLLSGNVMTSRINRNLRTFHGATALGRELLDFMTSDDPWFRPVDLQLGPDGQLYVADFYNKIIGHYEVPLDHPGRDRNSGRIWQIRYTAEQPPTDASGQISRDPPDSGPSPQQRVRAFRLLELPSQTASSRAEQLPLIRDALNEKNPHVVRAAAESLGRFGQAQDVKHLLAHLPDVPPNDPVLRQTMRIAIRDLLAQAPSDSLIWSMQPNPELASILLGLPRPEASHLILDYLSDHPDASDRNVLLSHAFQYAATNTYQRCIVVARKITVGDQDEQYKLLEVLCSSPKTNQQNVSKPLHDWAQELVHSDLVHVKTAKRVVGWYSDNGKTWPTESRKLSNDKSARLVSSFGLSEKYTGRLISDPFPAPNQIQFWIAGHNGFPNESDHGKNRIRLRLSESDEVLNEVTPPRNDVAQRVTWNLSAVQGRDVYFECIDGDSAKAYAWMAFGDFQPTWIENQQVSTSLSRALRWIKKLDLRENLTVLTALLDDPSVTNHRKIEIAGCIAALRDDRGTEVALRFLQQSNALSDTISSLIVAMQTSDSDRLLSAIELMCKRLSYVQQHDFAIDWATQGADLNILIRLAEAGAISRDVFADPSVKQVVRPRLNAVNQQRVEELTKGVDFSSETNHVLDRLKATISKISPNHENGHQVFLKHCASCHQLRGAGAVIGPQLDGAITRSIDRLLEDIITPDRNVDRAFRTSSFLLDDGRLMIGLVVAESSHEITIVQPNGENLNISPEMVEIRQEAGRSLMPSNLSELLSDDQFADLINYLRGP